MCVKRLCSDLMISEVKFLINSLARADLVRSLLTICFLI